VTPEKPLEDILAEYTEDLLADRKPRLAEDAAALNEEDRAHLPGLLALVRRLKAAHREAPPPRDAFLQHLDTFVQGEVAAKITHAPQGAQSHVSSRDAIGAGATGKRLHGPLREAWARLVGGMASPSAGILWRYAAAAVLVLLLTMQVQLYLQVRRLEQENRALVARLERMSPSGSLAPLGLPREQRAGVRKGAEKASGPSIDDLLIGVELRMRMEQRIGELEKEVGTRTGRDRRDAEALLRELRALLQPPSRP
jgi:hypothetical protein